MQHNTYSTSTDAFVFLFVFFRISGENEDIANTYLYFCHVNFQVFVIFDHKTISACSHEPAGFMVSIY